MSEKNVRRFEVIQSNEKYILTTSLLDNMIKIVCQNCQNPNMQTFFGVFSLNDLIKINKNYFIPEHRIDQLLEYINGFI